MLLRAIMLISAICLETCLASEFASAQAGNTPAPVPRISDCEGYASYVEPYRNLNTFELDDSNRRLEGYFHIDLSKTNHHTIDGLLDEVQACVHTLQQELYSIPKQNAPPGSVQKAEHLRRLISSLQSAGTSLLVVEDLGMPDPSNPPVPAPRITDCEGYASYMERYAGIHIFSEEDANADLEGYFHIDLSKTSEGTVGGLQDQVKACIRSLQQEQQSITQVNAPPQSVEKAKQLGRLIASLQGPGTSILEEESLGVGYFGDLVPRNRRGI